MSSITIPAGRSFRRSDAAKWVDPQPEKGSIEVRLDQGIVNFIWRNKETGTAEDELLIFPSEATFEPVKADSTGRSYMLKFNSSNQVHFFWLQRGTVGESDARQAVDINGLLQDPDYVVGSAPIPESYLPPASRELVDTKPSASSAAAAAGSGAALAAAATSATATPTPAAAGSSSSASTSADSRNQDMANLLFKWADQHVPIPEAEEASLTDILTPSTVGKLLAENPALASALAAYMPKDLGAADTPDALLRVVGTSQFRDAVSSLEMALRTGTLPESTMPWMSPGKASGAGDQTWNLRTFLTALRDAGADEVPKGGAAQEDEKMDTDE